MHHGTDQEYNLIMQNVSDYVYLSVCSYIGAPPRTSILRLQCSSNKDKITNHLGDYELCHSPDNTLQIKVVRGDVLCLSMKSKDKSIMKVTTLWNCDAKAYGPLDEKLYICVGSLAREESTVPYQRGVDLLDLPLDLECPEGDQSKEISLCELIVILQTKCPNPSEGNTIIGHASRLIFKVHWPQGENHKAELEHPSKSQQMETGAVKRQRSESDASEAPQGKKRCGQSEGIELDSGSAVLFEIALKFDEGSTYHLAAILLEKKCTGGGNGFIKRNTSSSGQPNWSLMAFKVLTEWCDLSQAKLFGADLLEVLEKVRPAAASQFKKFLGIAT